MCVSVCVSAFSHVPRTYSAAARKQKGKHITVAVCMCVIEDNDLVNFLYNLTYIQATAVQLISSNLRLPVKGCMHIILSSVERTQKDESS